MFDRDISFFDVEYLRSKMNINGELQKKEKEGDSSEEFYIGFIRDKVLKINRKRAKEEDYNFEEEFEDIFGVKNIYF